MDREEFNRVATKEEIERSRRIGEQWERRNRQKEQIIISAPLSLLNLGYGPIIPNSEFAKWAKDHPKGGSRGITYNLILSIGGVVESENFIYWNNKEKSMGFDIYMLGLRKVGLNIGCHSDVGLFIDFSIDGPLFTVYADTGGSGQFDLLFMTYNQGEFAEGGGNFGNYIDNVWGYNVGWQRDAYKDEVEEEIENRKEHRVKDYPDELGYMHDYLLGRGYWCLANVFTGISSKEALQNNRLNFNPRQRHVLSKLRAFELGVFLYPLVWLGVEDSKKFEDLLKEVRNKVERKKKKELYDDPSYER